MSAITATFAARAQDARAAVTLERVIAALLAVMVAVNMLFLVGLVASGGETTTFVNVVLPLASQWVPVSILWLVAWRTHLHRPEVVWAAVAVTVSAIGDSYFSLAMDADGYLAFPSPADVGYLLFYPLMIAALVVLIRRQLAGSTAIVLIESAVATLGAAAFLALLVDPIITGAFSNESVIGNSVALAYPLFDLVLIALVAAVVASPHPDRGSRWWSLALGLGLFAAADITYALLESQGSYLAGSPLDATWAIGLGFITWWVVGVGTESRRASQRPRLSVSLPVTAVAVFAGLFVLVVGTQLRVSLLAVVLASLTVGLAAVPIVFRQAMLGRLLADQQAVVQRLTELDRSKSDTMTTINHEFRKPVATINSRVAQLLDGPADQLASDGVCLLRTIEDEGARLEGLIDELLTMSRLEAGSTPPSLKPLYLRGVLTRAAASARPLSRTRNVEISVECDQFLLVVDADAGQLERAIADLIENAVRFSHPGAAVTVVATEDDGAVIRITDTGIGIPEHDLPRLAERFFRGSNVSEDTPGAGLGFSIAQHTIESHGGTIEVDSVLDEGTAVTVRLPLSTTGVPIPAFPGVRSSANGK